MPGIMMSVTLVKPKEPVVDKTEIPKSGKGEIWIKLLS